MYFLEINYVVQLMYDQIHYAARHCMPCKRRARSLFLSLSLRLRTILKFVLDSIKLESLAVGRLRFSGNEWLAGMIIPD